ncbi:MAG: Holliday junction resolvase RuvX [Gammaproteobacteria bacterium]
MILLALDVGRKKTGIAIGNLHTRLARPLGAAHGGRTRQLEAIGGYVREWQPQKLLIGLPRNMDGSEHGMTRFCRGFAAAVSRRFGLPVELADERLTTAAARAAGAKKSETDAWAAGILLQDWLRRRAAA